MGKLIRINKMPVRKARKSNVFRRATSFFKKEQEKRISLANSFPFEKLKPGKYAAFYPRDNLPNYFRSMSGENALGSTPGEHFGRIKNVSKEAFVKPNPLVPQIRLFSGNELKAIFEEQLSFVNTPKKRAELETLPNMKRIISVQLRSILAGVDWLEQTHKIKVRVELGILKWIGKSE